jgi:outer membrane protein assembly factor BamE (lipoprotein component of BamABCDE complex)
MHRRSRLARALVVLALSGALAACAGVAPSGGPSNRITTDQIARLQRGMSMEDVRKLLGEPTQVDRMGRGRGEVWTYNYIDRAQATPHMQLFVWFDPTTGTLTRFESGFNQAMHPSGN